MKQDTGKPNLKAINVKLNDDLRSQKKIGECDNDEDNEEDTDDEIDDERRRPI